MVGLVSDTGNAIAVAIFSGVSASCRAYLLGYHGPEGNGGTGYRMKGGQHQFINTFPLENRGSEIVRVHGFECLERESFSMSSTGNTRSLVVTHSG